MDSSLPFGGRLEVVEEDEIRELLRSLTCPLCDEVFESSVERDIHQRRGHVNIARASRQRTRILPPHVSNQQRDEPIPSTSATHDAHRNVSIAHPSTSYAAPYRHGTLPYGRYRENRRGYHCRECRHHFMSRRDLFNHQQSFHQRGRGPARQAVPWSGGEDPFEDMPHGEEMRRQYNLNSVYILAPHRANHKVKKIYNFPVDENVTDRDITEHMNHIYQDQAYAYKLNCSLGLLLEYEGDGEDGAARIRYFRPAANMQVFSTPLMIWDRHSLQEAIRLIQEKDLNEYAMRLRPNTKYKVRFVTQIEYYVYLTDFTLGYEIDLPDYILNKRCILTRKTDSNGRPYEKNMCFFTALAQYGKRHMGEAARRNVHCDALHLFQRWFLWCYYKGLSKSPSFELFQESFKGVDIKDMDMLEECFEISINIFHLEASGESTLVYASTENYRDKVNLNLYKNHLNLILNLDQYCKRFVCSICGKMFRKRYALVKHNSSCLWKTKYHFPGGYYKHHRNIFQELEEIGVLVPTNLRVDPFFAVWDMEAMLEQIEQEGDIGAKLSYSHKHKAVSCSIASNVNGFTEPYCIVKENTQELVNDMFERFHLIWRKATSLRQLRWAPYLRRARDKLHELQDLMSTSEGGEGGMDVGEGEGEEEGEEGDAEQEQEEGSKTPTPMSFLYEQVRGVLQRFEEYTQQLVILSFNGSRYDTLLIKEHLCSYLYNVQDEGGEVEKEETYEEEGRGSDSQSEAEDEEGGGDFFNPMIELKKMGPPAIIKRVNKYIAISNKYYRFLDITNYLPPGTSYANFLKSFEVNEQKFYFPYEFLTSYDKLSQPFLPPYPSEDWYSSLKEQDILHAEYASWEQGGKRGTPPLTGLQNYQMIETTWRDKGWRDMKDYLIYYNNCDTEPFVIGAQKMLEMYIIQGVDLFKETVSVPGVARIKLMKQAQEEGDLFPIFGQENRDLYFMFKAQLAAGPSIIFTRYQEKGKTPLREDGFEVCDSIYGYDVNSLYLYCIGGEMPTGNIVRRDRLNNYKPKYNKFYGIMHAWLKYVQERDGVKINSLTSNGREVRVGKYYVDGLAVLPDNTVKVYEFYGCHWHGHQCHLNQSNGEESEARYQRTKQREEFLKNLGYQVEVMWECDFRKLQEENPSITRMEYDNLSPFTQNHRGSTNEDTIISAIMSGELSGFALVDIEVPNELKDYFADFPPLFANHHVSLDDIGRWFTNFLKIILFIYF